MLSALPCAVDGDPVPVPHFGVALSVNDFQRLAERLKGQVDFAIEPHLRFGGEPPGHGLGWTEQMLTWPYGLGQGKQGKAFVAATRSFCSPLCWGAPMWCGRCACRPAG